MGVSNGRGTVKPFLYPLVDELDYNLIVGVHLPFEYKTPSRYPLAYITVVIAFIYVSYFVMVTDLIMQAHLLHLLCQFNVLADCFENMLNDCVKGFEGPLVSLHEYIHPLIDEFEYNLMVGLRLPFSFDTPLRYLFTYVIVLIAFNYTAHYVMVTDLIMQSYLIPLICQYAVLADCFENILIDCSNDYGDHARRNDIVYSRSMELRAILSRPMLGQLASSGLLICFVGYQATTSISVNIVKCLMSLFYLGYNMFTLFVVCRWCEEITNKSLNIGNAVYCSGWESGMTVVPTVRSTILLVILRANKPIVFTAGGMYNLSLTSYTSLVKGSYSALTFLLRIQHE
ncbi:olfactory receptor 64 [Bombyx mori]|uniref:Odorant receptor n=1 Tax=Bombyx mori TaxID=7091 RepID=C4B7Z3_BOMMO|nr:olfactory receptor 64 [Bombyx mori]BAH66359.1 olfactory receptor [Bombyx mori]